jgi:hypothetical protein
LAVAVALLLAKPWGAFSWDEWLVVAAPLLLLVPAMRRLDVFVVGLVASGLAWYLLGDQSGSWMELVCLLIVLVAGTNVSYHALRGNAEAQQEVGPITNEKLFFDALNRELCRTRRDGGSFAVLSLDLQADTSDEALNHVFGFLDEELRAYADIARVGNRILALVPDVEEAQVKPLQKRLVEKWKGAGDVELRIGLALFPQDAICAGDLIDLADRKRLVRGIAATTNEDQIHAQGQMSM